MKRVFVAAIAGGILCLLPQLAHAETVMLYTQMQLRGDSAEKNVERFVAVEDGVMTLFFDSGNIIFDTGLPQKTAASDTLAPRPESWAVDAAKEGGARWLLEIKLVFPQDPYPATVPASIHYKFTKLATGETISEGDVTPSISKHDLETKKPYDLCFALGEEVARDAMKGWQVPSSL